MFFDPGVVTLHPTNGRESVRVGAGLRIAGNRTDQLKEAGSNVATMCPICLVSLRKAAKGTMQVNDISDTLAKAYGV